MIYVVIACAGCGAFKLIGTYSTIELAREAADKVFTDPYTGFEDAEIHTTVVDSSETTFIEYTKP